MSKVHLAKGLSVDAAELASQVLAAIGMRGSGKSNIMAVIAEQLLLAKIQVLILDYVGIWPSLRLEADGKTPSKFDIPVLGGNHGDIVLLPTSGTLVAQALARSGSSAVLDVSRFSKTKRCTFATDFAESLFEAKKDHPGPTFFILEEAQRYIPQKVQKGQERMLGAFEEIAEVGRNFGLGLGLLSQRPQKLNKDVLNLTELLFAFQANGVLERKAISEWVQEKEAEGRTEVKDELPSLQKGEALTWSPSWLRIYGKYKLNKKTTYDAGKTPTHARATMRVRPLDLAVLEKDMAAVVAQSKAEDPKVLRAEITRLTREIAKDNRKAPRIVAAMTPTVPKGLVQAIGRTQEMLAGFSEELCGLVDRKVSVLLGKVEEAAHLVADATVVAEMAQKAAHNNAIVMAKEPRPQPGNNPTARKLRADLDAREGNGEQRLSRSAQAALVALAQKGGRATAAQVAIISGYSLTSSGFQNGLSELRSGGLMSGSRDALLLLDAGRALVPGVDPLPSGEALLAFWMNSGKLGKCERAVLKVIYDRVEVDRETLADESGYSLTSSGFQNALSTLRTLELASGPSGGGMTIAEVFR
jgi:hypothetical protein